MPIKSCSIKGKKGYKWGNRGKCYSKRTKARKQGVAVLISQGKIKVKRRR